MSAADARGLTYLVSRFGGPDGLAAVAPDNTVRWRTQSPTGASLAEPVIDADTTLYTATRNVRNTDVMAVRHDGSILWTRTVPNSSYIPRLAVLADGTVLVTVAFCLYRFAAATGDLLDTIEFPTGVESGLAVVADGTIYVVIADGRLLALQGWAPLQPDAPWPIWRRDNARTASVPRP
jgi:outer membrane protein assembly factor BamB